MAGKFGTKDMAFDGGPMPYYQRGGGMKTNKLAPGGTGKNSAWLGVRTREVAEKYKKTHMANAGMQDSSEELRIDGGSRQSRQGDFSKSGAVVPKFRGGLADGLVALRAAQRQGETTDYQGAEASGTSIFDPVLCELAYRWFCPAGGSILDPFAGGSVRGIVAGTLGYQYTGIDLRAEQIAANEEQAKRITPQNPPRWIVGDSRNVQTLAPGAYDLIFSCPPYGDLEVYGDDPADISTMPYDEFLTAYREIITASVAMLKPNRFACFVVGDFRDAKGYYRNFVAETIRAFQDAGMTLYNEAVLVTAVGSLPIRIGKQFGSYRKLGKTHQNVLCFYRGDIKAIKEEFGEIEVTDIAAEFGEVVS